MGRLHGVYAGLYTKRSCMPVPMQSPPVRNRTDNIPFLTRLATTYFWAAYSSINGNYLAIATICLIVLLSFLLPDISQKIHKTHELKAMKKVLQMITKEISKAEVACLTVAGKINSLQTSVRDVTTETLKDQQDLAVCTSNSSSMRETKSAPVQADKKIGFFRRIFFPCKNTSHKEVTLMSYLYTDSFDALKNKTRNKQLS